MLRKSKRYVSLLIMVFLVVTVFVSGCGQSAATGQGSSGTAKVVNIGWTGPLSGGAAQFGKDTLDGLNMAVDEINSAGGITVNGQKYTFKVVALDDQYKPDMSATNGRRLATQDKAPVIFVNHAGGTYALQQFNTDSSNPFLLAVHSSDPGVAAHGNKLTFVGADPFTAQPDPYSKQAMQKFGKKLALIPAVTPYGQDWGKAMTSAWTNNGGTVTGTFPMDYNTETDYASYVTKALSTNPDVIFLGGPSQPDGLVIKEARQQGFKGGFILCDQASMEDVAKVVSMTDLNGTIGFMPLSQLSSPGVKKFVAAFEAKYNRVPTFHNSGMYYDMKVIAKGMEKAGSVTDPAKILTGMKQVLPITDDSVPYQLNSINDKGQMIIGLYGTMISNGKYGQPFSITPQQ